MFTDEVFLGNDSKLEIIAEEETPGNRLAKISIITQGKEIGFLVISCEGISTYGSLADFEDDEKTGHPLWTFEFEDTISSLLQYRKDDPSRPLADI